MASKQSSGLIGFCIDIAHAAYCFVAPPQKGKNNHFNSQNSNAMASRLCYWVRDSSFGRHPCRSTEHACGVGLICNQPDPLQSASPTSVGRLSTTLGFSEGAGTNQSPRTQEIRQCRRTRRRKQSLKPLSFCAMSLKAGRKPSALSSSTGLPLTLNLVM